MLVGALPSQAALQRDSDFRPVPQNSLVVSQGAFYALRPEDLRRRPDVFVGVAASFCQ